MGYNFLSHNFSVLSQVRNGEDADKRFSIETGQHLTGEMLTGAQAAVLVGHVAAPDGLMVLTTGVPRFPKYIAQSTVRSFREEERANRHKQKSAHWGKARALQKATFAFLDKYGAVVRLVNPWALPSLSPLVYYALVVTPAGHRDKDGRRVYHVDAVHGAKNHLDSESLRVGVGDLVHMLQLYGAVPQSVAHGYFGAHIPRSRRVDTMAHGAVHEALRAEERYMWMVRGLQCPSVLLLVAGAALDASQFQREVLPTLGAAAAAKVGESLVAQYAGRFEEFTAHVPARKLRWMLPHRRTLRTFLELCVDPENDDKVARTRRALERAHIRLELCRRHEAGGDTVVRLPHVDRRQLPSTTGVLCVSADDGEAAPEAAAERVRGALARLQCVRGVTTAFVSPADRCAGATRAWLRGDAVGELPAEARENLASVRVVAPVLSAFTGPEQEAWNMRARDPHAVRVLLFALAHTLGEDTFCSEVLDWAGEDTHVVLVGDPSVFPLPHVRGEPFWDLASMHRVVHRADTGGAPELGAETLASGDRVGSVALERVESDSFLDAVPRLGKARVLAADRRRVHSGALILAAGPRASEEAHAYLEMRNEGATAWEGGRMLLGGRALVAVRAVRAGGSVVLCDNVLGGRAPAGWVRVRKGLRADALDVAAAPPMVADRVCLFLGSDGEGSASHFAHAAQLARKKLVLVGSRGAIRSAAERARTPRRTLLRLLPAPGGFEPA